MKKTVLLTTLLLVVGLASHGEIQWGDGRWRLEVSGGPSIYSGGSNRSGDYLLKGTVEYELPASSRLTLGLRMLPLFVYEQDERTEPTVWGGGAGLGLRIYSVADEYRGWFADIGSQAVAHKKRIADNSSNLNFISGIGAGYKCKAGWHTTIRWEHISNAHLGRENSGANLLTLGFGYTF